MMNSAYIPLPTGPKASEHCGKWTLEEKQYADALVVEFEAGTLDIEEGVSLRRFLSLALNCSPKRISKKYEGSHYNGKMLYKKPPKEALEKEEVQARKVKLQALENEYRESLMVLKMVEESRQTSLSTTGASAGSYGDFGAAPNSSRFAMSPLYALQQVGAHGQQDISSQLRAQRQRLSQLRAGLGVGQTLQFVGTADPVLQAFKTASVNSLRGDVGFTQRQSLAQLEAERAFAPPRTPLEVARSNDSPFRAYRATATADSLDGGNQGLHFPQMERAWFDRSHGGNASTGLANLVSGSVSPNIRRLFGNSLGSTANTAPNRWSSSGSTTNDIIDSAQQGFLLHQMEGRAAILPLSLSTLRPSSSLEGSNEKNAKRAEENALLLAALTKNLKNDNAGTEGTAKRKRQNDFPADEVAAQKLTRRL